MLFSPVVFIPYPALHVLQGDTVVLDCNNPKSSDSVEVKWTLSRNESSNTEVLIHVSITPKQGRRRHTIKIDDDRRKMLENGSLVIHNFDKKDEGTYVCEVCSSASPCTRATSTCILGEIYE